MKRRLFLFALLLPLMAMLTSIAVRQSAMADSSQWQIPITGLDLRAPFSGRYVRFEYDWKLAGDASPCLSSRGCDLCLDRNAGPVRATAVARGTACPHRIDVPGSGLTVRPLRQRDGPTVVFSGRIFVSEASGPLLAQQLGSGRAAAVVRLDTRGRLLPRALVILPAPGAPEPAG